MRKILIVGGQMENKGAQAMTFTVVNEIKERYPDKELVLVCPDEDRNYAFQLVKMGKKMKLELLGGVYTLIGKIIPNNERVSVTKAQMKEILQDTDLIVDISGFALSSQFSIRHTINYLANIRLARQNKIPMVLLSQSFGPFEYSGVYKYIIPPMIKKYIRYPRYIYAREQEGADYLGKYTSGNVRRSVDIVLQGFNPYNLSHLFRDGEYMKDEPLDIKPNAVGIVPNVKTMKYGTRQAMLAMYEHMVRHLLKRGKSVYLFRHSTEDLIICQEIKRRFPHDERVVLLEDEYDCIAIHDVLAQFDFLVASRYHSIVHAYKNGIPVVALGWATKYRELLGRFGQGEYVFDVRDSAHIEANLIARLDAMMEKRDAEAAKISSTLGEIHRENIFAEAFAL
ncbi:polysaccharide pyruvyl transferase family protein [Cohnella sp. 56]|uniref:polysaccharide pyruvyl transferase family protein n=1 Tax=Cohnella sp. 56 TaxID=3113722 RepID=UPI0030E81F77